MKTYISGFSLVELSIVLVILGLLTGGILTGQSLIKASELRAVTTELQQFQAAIQTFKDKYFALPGDITNATLFWGKNAAQCNSDSGVVQSNGTCNGNGDGIWSLPSGASLHGETFMAVNQLALANLISGTYTGVAGSGALNDGIIGVNIPASKFTSAGWQPDFYISSGSGASYDMNYGSHLIFGTKSGTGISGSAALTPAEAWSIDKKIDDGRPAYGHVIARFWNNLCSAAIDGTHSSNDLEAEYKLSDTNVRCALRIKDIF